MILSELKKFIKKNKKDEFNEKVNEKIFELEKVNELSEVLENDDKTIEI